MSVKDNEKSIKYMRLAIWLIILYLVVQGILNFIISL